MAGEGANEIMGGFGDAGGVDLEQLQDWEETMSDLGFIEDHDDDGCKVIWEVDLEDGTVAGGGGGDCRELGSGKRSILVTNLQDATGVQERPYSSEVRSRAAKSTNDISGIFSGTNSLPNSSKESTEYSQRGLQKQITGNNKIGFDSGLNMNDGGCLAAAGGPLARLHGHAKQRMVQALSAQPYHPVFPISRESSSSSSSQHPKVVNQMLEFPEHHQGIYPASHLSFQSSIGGNTTFMTPHVEEPHYQENVSLVPSVWRMDHGEDSNIHISSLGINSEFSRAPTFLHQETSDFTQQNSPIRGSVGFGSSLIRPGPQVGQSTFLTPAHPLHLASEGAGAAVPGRFFSSISEGSSSRFCPNMSDRRSCFIPICQPGGYNPSPAFPPRVALFSSQGVHEMGFGRAENSDMLIAEQLHKLDGNSVTLQAMILHDKKGCSFRRGSSEDALKMMRFLEACICSLFDVIPAIIMDRLAQMKDSCSGIAMGIERSRSPHSATAVLSTILGILRFSHRNDFAGSSRSDTDFTQTYDSQQPDDSGLSLIEGQVARFCIDQFGSRFLQEKIATATPEEKAMVFREVIPCVAELVTDAFGNYVVQKLIVHGAPGQRRIIIEFLIGNALSLSCHIHGCRVIQRAIEIGDLDQKIQIANELAGNILRCIDDQNANHVVQKCIEYVPQQHLLVMFKSMYGHVVELSSHPYGCRVIQKIFEHCNDRWVQEIMLSEVMEQVFQLAKDKYGNYIVQHILQNGTPPLRSAIIRNFSGRVMAMSRGKFSSNVIEKCLTYGSYEEKQMIINEVLGMAGETEALAVMVDDPFANYVVQKMIETCEDWQRQTILRRLKTHLGEPSRRSYGRHVVARFERLIRSGERIRSPPRHFQRAGKALVTGRR